MWTSAQHALKRVLSRNYVAVDDPSLDLGAHKVCSLDAQQQVTKASLRSDPHAKVQ